VSKPTDKFEGARVVVETLKDFDSKEQEMIFRWAAESLGLPEPFSAGVSSRQVLVAPNPTPASPASSIAPISAPATQDIKSFVAAKNPRSDVEFAATVAYYYQFVAPDAEKKNSITEEDLIDAYRKMADRERPAKPYFTLNNAFHKGLLDRPTKGAFSINAVGENLVAMALPGDLSVGGGRKVGKKAANGRKVKRAVKMPRKRSTRSKS
jgi:hypothetical protein